MATIAERNIIFRIQTDTKRAQKDIAAVKKDVTGLNGVVRNAAANFAGLAAFDVAGRITSGLKDITNQSIKLALASEQTTVAFETFLGSANAARKVLAQLNQFSTVTPFEPEQVIQAGKALLAFGFTAEELVPTLKSIGDISAGTGKDFNELALIFGKARTAGVIMADELNQLTEAGIPIISQFAKQFGKAESEIKAMASAGEISFGDLEKAFQDLTNEGGIFFDLTAKQSQTLAGRISTLTGNFNGLLKAIGERFLPTLGAIVDTFSEFVGLAKDFAEVALSEEIENERLELNLLVAEITEANTSEERRAELIGEIQAQYPGFLANIDAETASNEQLRGRLIEVNKLFVARIKLQQQQERADQAGAIAARQQTRAEDATVELRKEILKINEQLIISADFTNETLSERVDILLRLAAAEDKDGQFVARLVVLQEALNRQTETSNDLTGESEAALNRLIEVRKEVTGDVEELAKVTGDESVAIDTNTDATDKNTKSKKEQAAIEKELLRLRKEAEKANERADKESIKILNAQIKATVRRLEAEQKAEDARILAAARKKDADKAQRIQDEKDDAAFFAEGERELTAEQEKEDAIQVNRERVHDERMESFKKEIEDEKAARLDAAQQQIEIAQFVANSILDIAQQQTAAQIEQLDILLDAQRQRVQNAVITAERGNAELLQAEEDRLTALTNARERAAERQQRIAQIQVAANQLVAVSEGVVAVTRAFAEGSFIQGIATSVALAAQVAAVVASINSAGNSVQGFAEGTEFVNGPGSSTSDSIPAMLSRGERVVPAATNARYFDALNEFQNGTPKADMMAAMMSGRMVGNTTDTSKMEGQLTELNTRLENLEMSVTLDQHGFSAYQSAYRMRQQRKNKLT